MPEGQWGSTCNTCRTIKAIEDSNRPRYSGGGGGPWHRDRNILGVLFWIVFVIIDSKLDWFFSKIIWFVIKTLFALLMGFIHAINYISALIGF